MNAPRQRILVPVAEIPSPEVGLFLAQMDDQSRRLTEDSRGASVSELAWQPRPGTNTIGMLMAHNAIVELFWISHAAMVPCDCPAVLGIGEDDDGMPIPEEGLSPATLAGKDLAFFDDLRARARAFTYGWAKRWTAVDLDRTIQRPRKDGMWTMNVRWILYHVLEHEAGHYGQVNLLRHLYRATPVGAGTTRAANLGAHGTRA